MALGLLLAAGGRVRARPRRRRPRRVGGARRRVAAGRRPRAVPRRRRGCRGGGRRRRPPLPVDARLRPPRRPLVGARGRAHRPRRVARAWCLPPLRDRAPRRRTPRVGVPAGRRPPSRHRAQLAALVGHPIVARRAGLLRSGVGHRSRLAPGAVPGSRGPPRPRGGGAGRVGRPRHGGVRHRPASLPLRLAPVRVGRRRGRCHRRRAPRAGCRGRRPVAHAVRRRGPGARLDARRARGGRVPDPLGRRRRRAPARRLGPRRRPGLRDVAQRPARLDRPVAGAGDTRRQAHPRCARRGAPGRHHPPRPPAGADGCALPRRDGAARSRSHPGPAHAGARRRLACVRGPGRLQAGAVRPVGGRLREHGMGRGTRGRRRRREPARDCARRRPQRQPPRPATGTLSRPVPRAGARRCDRLPVRRCVRVEAVGRGPGHPPGRGVRLGPIVPGHAGGQGTLHFSTSPLRYGALALELALWVVAMGYVLRSRRRPA